MEDVDYITKYIGVWGWQILSINFIIAALIMVSGAFTIKTSSVFIAFVLSWIICMYMMLRRKKELEDYE